MAMRTSVSTPRARSRHFVTPAWRARSCRSPPTATSASRCRRKRRWASCAAAPRSRRYGPVSPAASLLSDGRPSSRWRRPTARRGSPRLRRSVATPLGAIAASSSAGRVRVATQFIAATPRPADYLVRRLAADTLPDTRDAWGPVLPIATGRTIADYREIARRWLAPALAGTNPHAFLETDRGRLDIELLPAEAPVTVAEFLGLVDRRFFDGTRWHRVVPNFVIQDGDPRGDGWGGPGAGFVLRDEINPVRYDVGTVGMALSGPNTGGSQYFITHSAQPHLDGIYTIFGRVVGGADALNAIGMGDRIRTIHR